MPFTTVRIPLAIAAALLLPFACGSEETPDRPQAATDAAAAADPAPPADPARKAAPNKAQKSGKAQIEKGMDPDGETVSLKGTDPAGKPFEARVGKNVEIPENFPADVPIFPGSSPMGVMTAAGHGTFVSLRTKDSQKAIYDYYLGELATQGWTVDSEKSFGGQLSITSTKDNRKIVVTVAGTEGDSRVSLVITETE